MTVRPNYDHAERSMIHVEFEGTVTSQHIAHWTGVVAEIAQQWNSEVDTRIHFRAAPTILMFWLSRPAHPSATQAADHHYGDVAQRELDLIVQPRRIAG